MPDLTLQNIVSESHKVGGTYRVSDFVSKAEQEEIKAEFKQKRRPKPIYDAIDAYCAEIIARFGYETYQKWEMGEISQNLMARWLNAERARSAAERLPLEMLLANGFSGCFQSKKAARAITKAMNKIIKDETASIGGQR